MLSMLRGEVDLECYEASRFEPGQCSSWKLQSDLTVGVDQS